MRIRKLRISESKFLGNSVDLGIPPRKFRNMLESNPLKSRLLVCGLAVVRCHQAESRRSLGDASVHWPWKGEPQLRSKPYCCCFGAPNAHMLQTYLHYITLHYITLHYITSYHITLRHITVHYITLHYISHLLAPSSASSDLVASFP